MQFWGGGWGGVEGARSVASDTCILQRDGVSTTYKMFDQKQPWDKMQVYTKGNLSYLDIKTWCPEILTPNDQEYTKRL